MVAHLNFINGKSALHFEASKTPSYPLVARHTFAGHMAE